MEKYKKYFDFSETINGTTYFLRNLLAGLFGFIGGFVAGYGIADTNMGLITLGLVILAPTFWFSFATIYKRVNALFPENASVIAGTFISVQVISNFFKDEPISVFFSLALLIFGLVLIFKNSGIPNHKG